MTIMAIVDDDVDNDQNGYPNVSITHVTRGLSEAGGRGRKAGMKGDQHASTVLGSRVTIMTSSVTSHRA